jgi:hypothetical protein
VLRRFRAGGDPEREEQARVFIRPFLRRFDRADLRRALPAAAERCLADVNVTERERRAVRRFVRPAGPR